MASYYASSSSSGEVTADHRDFPHVLAVDDNHVDRKIIETMLRNSSCRVTTVENGTRALEYLGLRDGQPNSATLVSSAGCQFPVMVILPSSYEIPMPIQQASKVNLVITDYCMPGMTGYELLKKIKGSSFLKEVPVVIVSSENVPTRINKCLEEGAKMFMLKPLKQSDVKKLRCHLLNCRS
ncbi:hypothetical protein MLD38_008810 [Melastoma candidum]|uniref:Uncharacterized protein n=1 Tax=Melastoma candidum TaxID=119954 RepID=A0ACB9RVQ6_9MYRT|nr:hypothetical protein MLD38_008810 [Melastoma candidum]